MNRFKRHPDARTTSVSEFYFDSYWSSVSTIIPAIPALQKSNRFRQELLFSSVFVSGQPELNLEQSEILFAISEKWRKVVDGELLNGTEPYITFEEFTEWGIRYPMD